MFNIPEGESVAYIPRGGYDPQRGYHSAIWDLTENLEIIPNAWFDIESTWVERAYFHVGVTDQGDLANSGDWYVEFLNGAIVVYPNTRTNTFRDFLQSASHGVHLYEVYARNKRDYILLREPTREVSQEQRDRRDVGVKLIEERKNSTVQKFLREQAVSRLKSLAYNRQKRK